MFVDYNLFFRLLVIQKYKKILRKSVRHLLKLSGLGEPMQKVVTVLSWNFKRFTPSGQGTERLTLKNGHGSAWLGNGLSK